MTAPTRWTPAEMMGLAARGLGKVDLYGKRGVTMVSAAEIEAMAGALATLGLRAIHPVPTETAPIDKPQNPLKGPADV